MKLNLRGLVALSSLFVAAAACTDKPKPPEPAPVEQPAAPTPAPTVVNVATPTPVVTPEPVVELKLQTVFFDFDSYKIRPDMADVLRSAASSLKANKSVKIQIEGHTDERGSNEYNLALGERRANAVRDFLVAEGVAADVLSTISYGEERPAAEGKSEDAWSKNRRAEFKNLGK